MSREDLSLSEARRIPLAAQGFDRARPRRVDARQLRRTIRQLGLLQIDYVNVLVPAHYQPLFSRLGPYDRSRLDDLVYNRREFTEQWAHEASILPTESWPLLRHRMREHTPWRRVAEDLQRNAAYVEWVLEQVRERGSLTPDDLPGPDGVRGSGRTRRGWPLAKEALEWHFARGELAVSERRGSVRAYDLAERVLPPDHHSRDVGRDEAQRELLRLAARAHGVGTAGDLADYYRMPIAVARQRVDELVEAGELGQVRVEGWREPAYLHPAVRLPGRISAAALLSPFDPVVWHRPRAGRLFGFDYRIEIYVPQAKRRWGYYVLPFLLGERLAARVDLKADRGARRLLVLAAYIESAAEPARVAETLAAELRTLAGWLDLDSVSVERRGGFARKLAAAVRV